MSRFVLWLDNAGDTEDLPARIGPKLARLAELRSAGLTVPEGFAVTADAHRLAGKSASMPEEVRSEVVAAYEELAVRCLRMNPPTAVAKPPSTAPELASSAAPGVDQAMETGRRVATLSTMAQTPIDTESAISPEAACASVAPTPVRPCSTTAKELAKPTKAVSRPMNRA